jgi:bacillithiol system protein YtxJ
MSIFKNLFGGSEGTSNASNVGWRPLTDLGQLNEIIQESVDKPVILFKHSTRCGVSRMTLKQFENEYDLDDQVTPYYLDLLEYRSISNAIAERFGVQHQSPQLLLIRNGKAVYDASHSDIYVEALRRYI